MSLEISSYLCNHGTVGSTVCFEFKNFPNFLIHLDFLNSSEISKSTIVIHYLLLHAHKINFMYFLNFLTILAVFEIRTSTQMTDKPLPDFEDDDTTTKNKPTTNANNGTALGIGLGSHSSVALGGFRDFCLKSELTNAIRENGFEHPSEVQHKALPQALLGADILGQAKSGMGKTAVFVFALLEQMDKLPDGEKPYCQALVVVHARELAYQVDREFKRFNKYLPHCSSSVFFGGIPEAEDVARLKKEVPSIVVGTPGRLCALIQRNVLNVKKVKYFVVDEFDRCLEDVKMRRDVQTIYLATPKEKQVLMFSATMTEDLRNVAKKFMRDPQEVIVDQQSKLTLHGLAQFHCTVTEEEKGRKLVDLLDAVEFNQCIIFTSSVDRCEVLNRKLQELKFPTMSMHGRLDQLQRLKIYDSCKTNQTRIVVATDLFGRGVDINRINLVVQFDMASDADSYLHRVGRAGRFGTKGVTVAFLTSQEKEFTSGGVTKKYSDTAVMKEVQERFEMQVRELTNVKEQLHSNQYLHQ